MTFEMESLDAAAGQISRVIARGIPKMPTSRKKKRSAITASYIAEQIRRPDEDLIAAINRVKNWAKVGALKAVETNPGSGRARCFTEPEMQRALILESLARIHLPVTNAQVHQLVDKYLESEELRFAVLTLHLAMNEQEAA